MAGAVSYPTGVQYREALYNTSSAFRDPVLRGGAPVLDPLGMPRAISGNFASVFSVNGTDGRRWAVKCFTRYVPDQDFRYGEISKALEQVKSPWKVEFQWVPDGLLCLGTRYPVLKMEWVEATGLLPYVEEHLTDQNALVDLTVKFGDLVRDLSRHGIAHGDLQHGNILVTRSGDLKLVDYDGMFVPGLAGLGASERGHANYQSPSRTLGIWGPDIDRFSSWVIYASLAALALDPLLWQALHVAGDETLLFHESDFTDRGASRVRYALANSSVMKLRQIARDIEFLWTADLAAIPPLESGPAPAGPRADWVRQFQAVAGMPAGTASAPAAASQERPIGAATWMTTHVPAGSSFEFSTPKTSIRITCALLLCLVVPCFVLSALVPLGLLLLVTVWTITFVSYLSSAEGRERHRNRKLFNERRAAAARASNKAAALEKAMQKRIREAEDINSAAARKPEKARLDEEQEIANVNSRVDREIGRIDNKVIALLGKENAEVARALGARQQTYVSERLRATRVSMAGIPGIGPAITANLASCGIVTAADVAAVRGSTIVRRDGRTVSPRGIGTQRASALYAWRLRVEAGARAAQPATLPWTQRQEIAQKYAQAKQSLENDLGIARIRATTEIMNLRQKWSTVQDELAMEIQETSARLATLRDELAPEITAARKQSATADWQRDFAKLEFARYRRIHYSHYVRKMVTG